MRLVILYTFKERKEFTMMSTIARVRDAAERIPASTTNLIVAQ